MAKEKDPRSWSVSNCTWSTKSYKILVKISWYYGNGKQDNKLEAESWRWVTDINNAERAFLYEDGKPAYEFASLSWAMDFCMMAALNGYNASVVLLPEWTAKCILTNNADSKQRKWIKEEFLEKNGEEGSK